MPSNKASRPTPDANAPRQISSSELFGDQRQVLIRHGATDYFLTITRQGKLILTK